jgi:NAD(P)-dependent dehydrogenase (short-subunit alcohol dehydrogenase family)
MVIREEQRMRESVASLFGLEDRIAVVTGGGGVLCSVMARALADAGARVAVLDLDHAKAEETAAAILGAGGQALALACDVLDEGGLKAALDIVAATWGAPDILVNGAGGNVPSGSTKLEFLERSLLGKPGTVDFFSLDFEGVRRTFDLNFLGTLLPTRVFARPMAERGSGCVLNIASMGALTPLTQVGAYSAAKAAVANFTAWLAVHFAQAGIRVNALAPGFLLTEQLRFLHVDASTGEPTPRARKVIAHTPMGRYGLPEELVGGLLYLVSRASSFVTGVVLPIDGGFSSYSI